MLVYGIAVPSLSAWGSLCLLMDKSDKSDQLPRMEDCVDHVGNASFVTKLDLLKGLWQVPLTDRAKEISAFVTLDECL